MKLYKKIILIFFYSIKFSALFPELLPDTMVFMGNRAYMRAKDLKVGYPVPAYNLPEHRMDNQKRNIVEIKTRKTKELILIEADGNKIIIGENQKIFNLYIKKFIPAKDFSVGDILFSPDKGPLTITRVEKIIIEDEIELYDIAMEEGYIFLILTDKKTHILVHNHPAAIPVLTYIVEEIPTFCKIFVSVASAIGAVFLSIGHHHHHRHHLHHLSEEKVEEERKKNPDLDDVLKDAKPVDKNKGESDVYEKKGGEAQREKDFDQINKGETKTEETKKGTVVIGTTQNGETVVNRDFSSKASGNKPTIEIQYGNNHYIKIRYDD